MRSLRYWFLSSLSLSRSIDSVITSLSSALSKKVPPYCRMSSGLSSRSCLMKSPTRPSNSGCYRKYNSFWIRNSSYTIVERRLRIRETIRLIEIFWENHQWSVTTITAVHVVNSTLLTFFFSISFFYASMIPLTPIKSWLLMKFSSSCSSSSSSSSYSAPARSSSWSRLCPFSSSSSSWAARAGSTDSTIIIY